MAAPMLSEADVYLALLAAAVTAAGGEHAHDVAGDAASLADALLVEFKDRYDVRAST